MKIVFYIDTVDGSELLKAKSDLIVEDCDLFDLLLSGDLSNLEYVREFEETVFKLKDIWWFNASKVEVKGDFAVLQAAFDVSAEKKVRVKLLKTIVKKWKEFLVDRKPMTINI